MHHTSSFGGTSAASSLRNMIACTVASLVFMGNAMAAADAPSGYTKCVQTGGTCSFSGTRQVAMGKSGVFGYGTFTSSVACTLANFPSAPSNSVWCSYAATTTSSSSSSASSVASSSSSSKSSASSVSSSQSSSSVASSSASSAASSVAGASLDLTKYKLSGTYSLPSKAAEASGASWNWDTDTLFVIGDEGKAIVQVSKTGVQIDSMTLSGFADTEGIAYIGNGKFVVTEERLQDAYVLTYAAGGTATRSSLPSVSIGSTVDNIGIEGISYDRLTENYVAVKEKDPQAVYGLKIDWSLKTITTSSLFDPAVLKTDDISDVQVLSSVASLTTAAKSNLLIVSQESSMLLEVTRTGTVVSKFDLKSISTDIEGVTVDKNGVIYLIAQTPKLYVLTLK
ncbi:SdiA-regulated domain-containing protein [Uliginosibacterium sp. H3]|uniref:SdiA-regulated domain-containing protein n=1 Tax=Uliginosibacterium silvisoli TaxID=3114758 RepID=A0ABU6JZJ1_9RHOO|nr:SdiA-regulated domain-containing protein [Uliginosibacterium sp. H3]